jgi:glycosyltransferase involved in cell wall biosynthesis
MPEFSIVIIARDEAHTLGRALVSLKPLIERGSEVVLMDIQAAATAR